MKLDELYYRLHLNFNRILIKMLGKRLDSIGDPLTSEEAASKEVDTHAIGTTPADQLGK